MRESRVRVRHPPGISATLLLDILPPYNLTTTDENYVRADLGYVLLEEANYIPHHALITAEKTKKTFVTTNVNSLFPRPLLNHTCTQYLHRLQYIKVSYNVKLGMRLEKNIFDKQKQVSSHLLILSQDAWLYTNSCWKYLAGSGLMTFPRLREALRDLSGSEDMLL